MVLYDFQKEIHAGFFVSYYRNFAIPSIARTLAGRGEMRERPMKRSYDTGIVIHEIIANGFDSDRGRDMTALLRRVHQGVPERQRRLPLRPHDAACPAAALDRPARLEEADRP